MGLGTSCILPVPEICEERRGWRYEQNESFSQQEGQNRNNTYIKLLRGRDVYVGYCKAIKKMRMFANMGSVNPK